MWLPWVSFRIIPFPVNWNWELRNLLIFRWPLLNFEIVMNAINHRSRLQSLHLTQISKPPQLAPTRYSHWNYLEFTSQECILSSFLQDQTQHNDRDWENYFVETIFSKYGQTCHRWWRGDLNILNLCFICSPHSSNHHDLDTTLCCLVSRLFLVTIVCSWSPGVSCDQVRDAVTFYDWPSPTSATWAPGVFATNYNTFARLAAPSNLSAHK